jgi:hypothetical protein
MNALQTILRALVEVERRVTEAGEELNAAEAAFNASPSNTTKIVFDVAVTRYRAARAFKKAWDNTVAAAAAVDALYNNGREEETTAN